MNIEHELALVISASIHPVDRVNAMRLIMLEARNPQNVWSNYVINTIVDFVWRTTNNQLALELVVALGEYAKRTKDGFALEALQSIGNQTHQHDIYQAVEHYI